MDIPKEVKANKLKESSSSSIIAAVLHKDVPIEVQVLSDVVDTELMSATSSDSDIGSAESCNPPINNVISKESLKTVLHYSNDTTSSDNGNCIDMQTEAAVEAQFAIFNGFEDDDDEEEEIETPMATISRSPSIPASYSSGASVYDVEVHRHHDDPDAPLFEHGDIVLAPNIDRAIKKEYTPSLNRISDDLKRLKQQLPVEENPWDFYERTNVAAASSSRGIVRADTSPIGALIRNRPINQTYSVGIQVNNPEIGNFVHRNTDCDWIRCMMCAVIVTCIITGLCAATVMILNTFFQYWLLP